MVAPRSKKIEASCLILAGGQGKRLTPDKPLLKIDNKPIIAWTAEVGAGLFEEVFVVTKTPEKYGFLLLPLVSDEREGCGPLVGIYSGLKRINCEAAFVCAADMPFLSEALIRLLFVELDKFAIVVPLVAQAGFPSACRT
jgi:molybdopterin-guanine dinucleotide biosynthesis protein A